MKARLTDRSKLRHQRAFSLLEILVAVGLLAVIIVGLLAMFNQTQRAFRSGTTQSDVLEAGRAVMSLLTRELQEMSATKIRAYNLFAAVDSAAPPSLVQPLPGGVSRENQLQDISFLTRANDEWVGIAYRISQANAGVGTLYRLVARSSPTGSSFTNRPPYPNIDGLSGYVTAATLNNNTNFHRVVDGIIHLRLLAYDSSGVLITNNFSGVDVFPRGYIFSSNALPAYMDLELGILEPRALDQFRARTNNPANALAFLEKQADKVHLFKQRIPIRTVQ